MYSPQTPYTQVALDSIAKKLGCKPDDPAVSRQVIPDEFYSVRRGCFVSLHAADGALRGCIGTIYPQEKHLFDEISRNAISASFNDDRFSPLSVEEFPDIEISVDVLTQPELIHTLNDLDPQIFGIMINDGQNNRAVLLPCLDGIDTIGKQLNVAKRKAGICRRTPWQELQVMRFTSNRYL